MPEDPDLLRQARAGDAVAWSLWYHSYQPSLFRYAYSKTGSKEDAEDIVADVFVHAINSIERFTYEGRPVLAWLFGIAHNVIAERRRRQSRALRAITLLDLPAMSERWQEDVAGRMDLRQAMSQLTPQQRQVIGLRFFWSLTPREVAAVMGKRENAVLALQFRALGALRRYLQAETKRSLRSAVPSPAAG